MQTVVACVHEAVARLLLSLSASESPGRTSGGAAAAQRSVLEQEGPGAKPNTATFADLSGKSAILHPKPHLLSQHRLT